MKIGQEFIGVFHAATGQIMMALGVPVAIEASKANMSDFAKIKRTCKTPIKIERFKLVRIEDKEVDNANK